MTYDEQKIVIMMEKDGFEPPFLGEDKDLWMSKVGKLHEVFAKNCGIY